MIGAFPDEKQVMDLMEKEEWGQVYAVKWLI
jgi:hypothetical protein